jgi:hypothetical protein
MGAAHVPRLFSNTHSPLLPSLNDTATGVIGSFVRVAQLIVPTDKANAMAHVQRVRFIMAPFLWSRGLGAPLTRRRRPPHTKGWAEAARAGIIVGRQPRVPDAALNQATTIQRLSDVHGDLLDQSRGVPDVAPMGA